MADEGELKVFIEDEGGASVSQERSGGKTEAEWREEANRAREATARYNKEAALNRINHAALTLDSELSAAKSEYSMKMEEGDFAGAAEAQERLVAAKVQRNNLETQAAVIQRQPQSFEERLNQYTAPTADWMRRHRDWVEDPRKSSKLAGAHHLAVGEGLEPDSPRYFRFVEKLLSIGDGGNGSNRDSGSNRDGNNMHSDAGGGNSVRLTKGEVEAANSTIVWNVGNTDSKGNVIGPSDPRVGKPIGNAEYGRRKMQMQKQHYYDRI